AWGTALATVAARAGRKVLLWAREEEVAAAINETRENKMFLPGIALDPVIRATNDLADLADCDALLSVTPAQALGVVARNLAIHLKPGMPFVICSKGLEQATGRFLTQVLAEAAPDVVPAVLSGPSFASDVAKGLPTAVTLACNNQDLGLILAEALGHITFRPYVSNDPLGAQIGGSVKNVIAIACGITEGKGFGASARAALTTRGFAELQRFGAALGAKPETIGGLSGLGDLILTCNSAQSRNMSLGIAMGEGKALEEVLGARNSVSEGVYTAAAVMKVARKLNVDMPISSAVHDIVSGTVSVDDAITSLMSRPIRSETG
ncbi:MAG: NAD(P)-dependent glycerol-3-phosphate dehydrogenase, partial [Fimbriimonadaceae bacterium]|nr:NAD(P)-dependent glycerol-3-phosphate dehydrogenase [Alphaproteobacteria bacterium]